MRKEALIFISLSIIFLSTLVSSLSTDLKESYKQGETIIIEVKAYSNNINKEDIEFRRNHVAVPFEYDVLNIDGMHFVWAIAPTNEQNYSLIIKNINLDSENSEFSQNFSVNNETAEYTIKPGAIYAKDEFEIEIKSNLEDSKTIKTDFPSEREITIKPGINKIKFPELVSNETQFRRINVGDYSVPAKIFPVQDKQDPVKGYTEIVKIFPEYVTAVILVGELPEYTIRIINTGDSRLSDLELIYNDTIFNSTINGLFSIPAKDAQVAVLKLRQSSSSQIKEIVRIKRGENEIILPISINFTSSRNETSSSYPAAGEELYYCEAELDGKICKGGQFCEGESKASIEGTCCLGLCKDSQSSDKSWIGWLIAGIALILLLYLYHRYKKAKPSSSLLDKELAKKRNFP